MRNEKSEWEFRNPAGDAPLPGSLAGRSAVKMGKRYVKFSRRLDKEKTGC